MDQSGLDVCHLLPQDRSVALGPSTGMWWVPRILTTGTTICSNTQEYEDGNGGMRICGRTVEGGVIVARGFCGT